MAGRDLGGLGEIQVELWAKGTGIVPNRVHYDEKGWDIFLEFSHAEPETTKYFLDIRPPELSCLVQVKATDKRIGKIPHIKLTNWERMAKSPLPCFFVVLEYNEKDNPQRAYIVHVGEYWIGKILERLRGVEAHPGKLLHKCSMQLTYSESDMIDSLNGVSLESAIRKHVGNDPQQYFNRKCDWINNVGYDKFRSRVHFTLPEMSYDSTMELLVDFGIGLTKEIHLDSLNVEDVRFGIPLSLHPEIKSLKPKITINEVPPGGKADVVISGPDDNILFQDSFNYFSPGTLFPFIPFEHWKIKFSSEIISFIIYMRDHRVNMNLNLFQSDKAVRISKLSKVAHFIRHLDASEKKAFKLDLTINDRTYNLGINSSDFPPISAQLNRILSTIENAVVVFNRFDQFDDPEVTPVELMSQSISLMMMKGYLNEERLDHISSIVDSSEAINLNSLGFINCLYAVFGKKVFVLSGAILGNGKITEEESDGIRIIIENGKAKCIRKLLISKNTFKKFNMDQFAHESFIVLDKQGIQSVIIVKGQPRPTLVRPSS